MKIGIIVRRLHMRGGTERRTTELLQGLLAAGHEVHLFAEGWEEALVGGLCCHRVPALKAARWLKALSFALFAARAVGKEHLDLIHSQARTFADDVATLGGGCHAHYLDHILADRRGLRRLWERNHPFHRVIMALEKEQYRGCARIILNSAFARQGLLRYFPWAEGKCRVIHNGVDAEFFRPNGELRARRREELQARPDTVIFLFVGSGFERKGLAAFLQAFALTRQRNPGYEMLGVIVGRGNFPFYRHLASRLGIERQVVFAGAVSDTRPFYCAGDVFVLPSKFDPHANTTNEALASGLPVITTRTNGASEVLTPREGYVVEDAGEVQEIAAAMEELLNAEKRLEMAARARQNARLRPWAEVTRKTLEVYQEILAERRGERD